MMFISRKAIKENAKDQLERNLFGRVWPLGVVAVLLFALMTAACAWIPYVGLVGVILLTGPLTVGYYSIFLGLSRGKGAVNIGDMFNNGFNDKFGRNIMVWFMKGLFVILWSIAFLLPGAILLGISAGLATDSSTAGSGVFYLLMILGYGLIIAGYVVIFIKNYAYRLAEFVALDHPEFTGRECVRMSVAMTKGHKGELFVLDLSFIGWGIVGTLCLCVGSLWVMVYQMTSLANYYDALKALYEGTAQAAEGAAY